MTAPDAPDAPDAADTPDTAGGPASPPVPVRARGWAGRVKATPSRVEWLFENQEAVNEALRTNRDALAGLAERIDRVERRTWDLAEQETAGVAAVGDELHNLRGGLEAAIADLAATSASHAATLHRAVATPARDAEKARLLAALGPAPALRPGLSVFTICWNHGGLLADSVRSGLAALDRLDPTDRGEVLVLDDGSSDETPRVAAALSADDPRVRVITAATNLGLARARNVLLHAVATTHAFQLDADNTATVDGPGALLQVARTHGAAFTYGNVVKVGPDGEPAGVMSNEPVTEPWFSANYVDTMAVVDVAVARALGGWPEDPQIEHVDDWALVWRLLRAGELAAFVPVLAGRYTALGGAFHLTVPDPTPGRARVTRTFNADGRVRADTVRAIAAHPDLGLLWASPGALAADPSLVVPEHAAPEVPERPLVLVVGPGGVANLGDDAIVAAGVERLRALLPEHDLDLVTDGPEPTPLPLDVVWLGPLLEAVRGLRPDDLGADPGPVVAAAAQVVGVGSAPLRPLDPGRYAAAVFLGGGTLTSLWQDSLVAPRAVLAAALAHAGVPWMVSGQGLGPLDDDGQAAVSVLTGGARAVAVRDAGSLALAGPGAQLTGDDALGLAPGDPGTLESALRAVGVAGPFVALTVRDADYVGAAVDDLDSLCEAVDALAAARGLTVVGVALNEQPAGPEVATLARLAHGPAPRRAPWRVLECRDDPRLLASVVAAADATVAHSYHAALLALAGGRPALLVAASPYYEAKSAGLRDLAGLPEAFVLPPGDAADLAERLDAVAAALAAGAGLEAATAAVKAWWAEQLPRLVTT